MNIDKKVLAQFIGTQTWHRFNRLSPNSLLTDGAQYVAEEGGAYWLMDIIASAQLDPKVKAEPFQVWKLAVNDDQSAIMEADDRNGNAIYTQAIPWTDFILDNMKLYAVKEEDYLIIMLPSEY